MDELSRLQALDSYLIMDTLPQKEFDDITELASIICSTPVSLVTLLDSERQWFKSKVGWDISQTPREHAFCHHAIQAPHEITIVEDAFQDERFRDNPLTTSAPHVRFYAGAPLVTLDGQALGSLCVIDHEPRTLTKEQQRALSLLSKRVMERLELRKSSLESAQLSRLSNQKFHTLTEQSPDFIAVLDTSLNFTYANKGHDSLSREELTGRSVLEGIKPEFREEFVRLCAEVLQGDKHKSMNVRLLTTVTGDRWVTCRLSPLRDGNGQVSSILMTGSDITEKLKAEDRERESRAHYEALFFNNPSPVAMLNMDGVIEDINNSSIILYGYTKEEAIGQDFMNFVAPSFYLKAAEAFQKAIKGEPDIFEGEAVSKSGILIDIVATVVPVIVDGQVRKLQVVTQDITEAKRAQELIRQQAEAQSSIFESVNEGYLTLDKNRTVTYLNSVCAAMLMKSKKEILFQPIFDLFPHLKTSSLLRRCLEVEETGDHVHFRETFPLSKKSLDIDIYPTTGGLAIHFLDISDKVTAREDYEKLYFVASRVKNGVLILDKDENIEWANESLLNLAGFTLSEAKGAKVSELLGKGNINTGTVDNLREKLRKGVYFSEGVEYVSSEGQRFWLHVDVTPSLDEHGQVKQYFFILSDYTQLKEAKKELRQQANHLFLQNKDLQEFTYIVSHNLRAPVANVLGTSNLMASIDKNSAAFDTALNHLEASAVRLDTVLRDMNMILSVRDKRGVLDREQVNIEDVWQQAFLDLQEPLAKCGGRVSLDIQEGLCINGIKAYLHSVFHNLLSNAIKYRAEERALHILVNCFGSPDKGTVISFSDNGSGFDREKAGTDIFKLYKRFHTSREGRGIGLYLVKTHIEAMGGRVEVSSQVNVGTKFLIHLD